MSLRLEKLVLPLSDFTLAVDATLRASVTGLCGPSGSGKTTLLEIIAGLRQPASGRVILQQRTLTDVPMKLYLPPEQRRVGYVPQDLALFPHLDTRANLFYGSQTTPPPAHLPDHVIEVLELRPLLHRSVMSLSGGEKQRVALGRALLANPEILLLDEPLSSLDEPLKARILPYLQSIPQEFKVPMIYVTHSAAELAALCGEVLYLERGKLQSGD
jgi:molybdate transport system ATP-binding protein